MAYLFLTAVGLAAWHFVWDAILAPSLRAKYRFDLFAVRDQARELRYAQIIDGSRFQYLNDSVNTAAQMLRSLTISAVKESRESIKNDSDLRRFIDERVALMTDPAHPEAKQLFEQITEIALRSFLVNSGGWFIYLIPIVAVVISFQLVRDLIVRMVALSEEELSRAIPRAVSLG